MRETPPGLPGGAGSPRSGSWRLRDGGAGKHVGKRAGIRRGRGGGGVGWAGRGGAPRRAQVAGPRDLARAARRSANGDRRRQWKGGRDGGTWRGGRNARTERGAKAGERENDRGLAAAGGVVDRPVALRTHGTGSAAGSVSARSHSALRSLGEPLAPRPTDRLDLSLSHSHSLCISAQEQEAAIRPGADVPQGGRRQRHATHGSTGGKRQEGAPAATHPGVDCVELRRLPLDQLGEHLRAAALRSHVDGRLRTRRRWGRGWSD